MDRPDVIYKTEKAKFNAVVEDIAERHQMGQPVLVGTVSVENSEILSQMLRRRGIPHAVLNAKFHAKEAEIVAQAGRKGAVTVATNMAGRGTDILLGGNPEFLAANELRQRGLDPEEQPEEYAKALEEVLPTWKQACDDEAEEVADAGGLYVLGTERHESRRIDNQLRGRAGRQGDPGESRFYLSLQDELMKRFRAGAVEAVMERFNIPEDVPIESKMVTRQIKSAQAQIEGQNAEIRKNVLKYDEVLNKQRQVIYAERLRVLNGEDLSDQVRNMIDDVVGRTSRAPPAEGYAEDWDLDQLWTSLKQLYPVGVTIEELEEEVGGSRAGIDADFLLARLKEDAHAAYDRREEELGERGDAPARADGAAPGHRPQVARAPLRDGLPPGGHQPAGVRPARPGGRVPARGLRHVRHHDGRHQGGDGRLPLQPGGPGRGAGARRGGRRRSQLLEQAGRDPGQGPRPRRRSRRACSTPRRPSTARPGSGAVAVEQAEEQAPALGSGARCARPPPQAPPGRRPAAASPPACRRSAGGGPVPQRPVPLRLGPQVQALPRRGEATTDRSPDGAVPAGVLSGRDRCFVPLFRSPGVGPCRSEPPSCVGACPAARGSRAAAQSRCRTVQTQVPGVPFQAQGQSPARAARAGEHGGDLDRAGAGLADPQPAQP